MTARSRQRRCRNRSAAEGAHHPLRLEACRPLRQPRRADLLPGCRRTCDPVQGQVTRAVGWHRAVGPALPGQLHPAVPPPEACAWIREAVKNRWSLLLVLANLAPMGGCSTHISVTQRLRDSLQCEYYRDINIESSSVPNVSMNTSRTEVGSRAVVVAAQGLRLPLPAPPLRHWLLLLAHPADRQLSVPRGPRCRRPSGLPAPCRTWLVLGLTWEQATALHGGGAAPYLLVV